MEGFKNFSRPTLPHVPPSKTHSCQTNRVWKSLEQSIENTLTQMTLAELSLPRIETIYPRNNPYGFPSNTLPLPSNPKISSTISPYSFDPGRDIRHTRTERLRKIDAGEHHHGTRTSHSPAPANFWNGKVSKPLTGWRSARSQHDLPESADTFRNFRPRSSSLGLENMMSSRSTKNPDGGEILHIRMSFFLVR